MKDLFSEASDKYAKFRPSYPPELITFLVSQVHETKHVWDCATGNGQLALPLSKHFDRVSATDISQQQMAQAPQRINISYSVQPAEKTDFPDSSFDLVTVGQAVHWFNFNAFYHEVKRTLKPNGLLAIIGYAFPQFPTNIQEIVDHLYKDVVGPFWDKERRFVDEHYKTIPFPFAELPTPEFSHTVEWDFDHLEGYVSTWSATKNYIKSLGQNPFDIVKYDLKDALKTQESFQVSFPILIRLGRLH